MIFLQLRAIARIQSFFRDNPIANFSPSKQAIIRDFTYSIHNSQRGVKTSTPILPQWERAGYIQVYCKLYGWFLGYVKRGADYYVEDAIHQQEISSDNGNNPPVFSKSQDMSVFGSWDYVRDANYGFGIVRNESGKFNFLDLNGDLLVKDKGNNPIWFEDLSVFYSAAGDDRLYAFAVLNGLITYVYSDGTFLQSNKTLKDFGIKSVAEMVFRNKRKLILSESKFRSIIREALIETLYS